MNFDAVAAELYGAEPEQFVALRKQRASDARAGGDRDLARRITGLRRPTRSAWIVNLLAGQAAADLDELLDLGAALAEAQQRLSAAELRQLSGQRHAAIAALVRRAGQLAQVHGHTPSDATLREVSDSLQAALSDPAVAEVVRQGRLTEAQEYGGFGPAFTAATAGGGSSRPAAQATGMAEPAGGVSRAEDDSETESRSAAGAEAGDQAEADAERDRLIDRLNSAQQALDRIREAQRRNQEQHRKAQALADQRVQRVDQLRDQLDRAEREARAATEDAERLGAQAEDLRRAEHSAEEAVADALAKLAGD